MIFDLSSLIPAVSFILYILFTVFGLYHGSKEKTRWSFILYMFAMALWSFGSFMMHGKSGLGTPIFWNRFMMFGMLGGPITIYHSLLDLSLTRKKRPNYLLYTGYLLYGLLLYLNLGGYIVSEAWFVGRSFHYTLGRGAVAAYVLSYSFLLLGILHLSSELRQTSDRTTRKKLTLPLYGAIVMLLGVLGNLYTPIGRYPVDLFAATINAILIFIAIYRFRLVHYSAVVLRGILYFVLVTISAFVFYGIIWVSSRTVRQVPFAYSFLTSLLLGLAASFIFQPLRTGAQSVMEKLYFGKRLQYYESLRTFSESLSSIVELEFLGRLTIEKIVDTFNLEWAFMLVLDYTSRNYKLISHSGLSLTQQEAETIDLTRNSPLIRAFSQKNGLIFKHNGHIDITLDLPQRSVELSPSLILPLKFKERINGGIILGERLDKEYYDQFDVEILEILAGQCSIALENAISFERLKRQQKRLQDLNKELLISRSKLEAFFDGITTPISIQDINYNIVVANYAAARYFGTTRDSLLGKKCYRAYFHRNRPCANCLAQDCLHTQLPFGIELKEDHTGTTFAIHFYPVAVPRGSDRLFLEFFQDISQQKQLQEELVQSEKLAGIGALASGIAHEINNPLGGILGTAEIMLEEIKPDSKLYEYTQDIINYSQNAAEVVKDLTNYSRREVGRASSVNIVELLETSLKLVQRGIRFDKIEVRKRYQDVSPIEGSPNELKQVFLNLLINAVQAMDRGGVLTLECRQENWHAFVSVKDTGQGIEEKNLENVFTPFFTTKDPGEGTGLGLSITHQIVYKMGGRINVESRVGRGTEFQLYLPITSEEKRKIRFVHARTRRDIEDAFFLQRKILVGEKGYLEETIRRLVDESAYHILAYKGLQPVGTVSCVTPGTKEQLPIEKNFQLSHLKGGKHCAEIDRLAVLKEERGGIIPLGLMTLAYLYAKSQNAERVFLDVFSDETKHIQMYKKLGFQIIGDYQAPLAVTVMLLDHKTDYERKSQRMERFVKPLMARLIKRIDFEEPERHRILQAVEQVITSQAS